MAKRFGRPSAQYRYEHYDPRLRPGSAAVSAPPRVHPLSNPERAGLHRLAEPVDALGIVGAEHAGQARHGPFGIKIF